jgi:hypothetical protein
MNRLRSILKNCLLAFVLISIGFVLGKHSIHQTGSTAGALPSPALSNRPSPSITIFYMHATIRCVTCNTIEKMTRELVKTQFSDECAAGVLVWRDVDFQKNEELARQFEVVSSVVVVARMKGDSVVDFKRLDKVWSLMDDPPSFEAYVSSAIQSLLAETGRGDAS